MTIVEFIAEGQRSIVQTLDRLVPPESADPSTIHKAMRYSLFAGGKRMRPLLALAAAEPRQMLVELRADGHDGIERGHRLLRDE